MTPSPYYVIFLSLVALKRFVSLISRLVACSARIVVDKQTDRQTHRPSTVTLAAHVHEGLRDTHACTVELLPAIAVSARATYVNTPT